MLQKLTSHTHRYLVWNCRYHSVYFCSVIPRMQQSMLWLIMLIFTLMNQKDTPSWHDLDDIGIQDRVFYVSQPWSGGNVCFGKSQRGSIKVRNVFCPYHDGNFTEEKLWHKCHILSYIPHKEILMILRLFKHIIYGNKTSTYIAPYTMSQYWAESHDSSW